MQGIGKEKHYTRTNSKEDRKNGNSIRCNTQAMPEQGKSQTYGTSKIDIKPFFRIHRLERGAKETEKSHLTFLPFTQIGRRTLYG